MPTTRAAGFSMIELMITIAIVAILMALAFPSFEGSMRSNRVATTTNELIASLSLARSEALRNPGGAVICTSTDGLACGGAWTDGWIVWIDVDGDGAMDPGDRVVRTITPNNRVTLTATAAAGSELVLRFDSYGRMVDNNIRQIQLQPSDCPTGQQLRRQLDIAGTGQVRTSPQTCT